MEMTSPLPSALTSAPTIVLCVATFAPDQKVVLAQS
jgi:hypothetical protein